MRLEAAMGEQAMKAGSYSEPCNRYKTIARTTSPRWIGLTPSEYRDHC